MNFRRDRSVRAGSREAFTLLELLTVIAVIAILAALLVPSLRSARLAANRASTRLLFNQWASAIESFRSEYGCYPVFHPSCLVNPPGQNQAPASLHLFHDILAGRRRDGSALPGWTTSTDPQFPEAQNRRRIPFHTFGAREMGTNNLVCDGSGNAAIVVLVDRDLDGFVRIGAGGDYASLPAIDGSSPLPGEIPVLGVRTGVLFYAPSPGSAPERPEFILSWK